MIIKAKIKWELFLYYIKLILIIILIIKSFKIFHLFMEDSMYVLVIGGDEITPI